MGQHNTRQRSHHISHAARHHALSAAHAKFILDASIPASQCEAATGVPASVTIAQAILESGWGAHHIGKANNYFGVKAQTQDDTVVFGSIASGYVTVKTKEHLKKSNADVTIDANFRSYAGMLESFKDHGMFLHDNPRYKKCIEAYAGNGDANSFAHGLQDAGYATDPHYAILLITIMKHHKLYAYNLKKPNL